MLWPPHRHSTYDDRTTLADDLLVAICEMHRGPWLHLGDPSGTLKLSVKSMSMQVDQLHDRLQAASRGLEPKPPSKPPASFSTGTPNSPSSPLPLPSPSPLPLSPFSSPPPPPLPLPPPPEIVLLRSA